MVITLLSKQLCKHHRTIFSAKSFWNCRMSHRSTILPVFICVRLMKTPLHQIKCFQGEVAASSGKETLLVLSQFRVPAPISVTSRCTSLHLHSPCCRLLALISITFPEERRSSDVCPLFAAPASDRLLIQLSPRQGHQISPPSAC